MTGPSVALARWHDLYGQFTLQGDPTRAYPKPTTDDLDRFEAETGIKLPASYRAYCLVFGAGIFDLDAVYLRVSAPYCPYPGLDLRNGRGGGGSSDVNDRENRLVYVADSFSGDRFGWDPEDVTDADGAEFGLYGAIRHGDVVKLADNFNDFIALCIDRGAFCERLDILDEDEDEDEDEGEDEDERDGDAPRALRDGGPKRVFAPASPDFI